PSVETFGVWPICIQPPLVVADTQITDWLLGSFMRGSSSGHLSNGSQMPLGAALAAPGSSANMAAAPSTANSDAHHFLSGFTSPPSVCGRECRYPLRPSHSDHRQRCSP